MLGGATGALVIGGIQNYNPAIVGLPERLITFRDNNLPAGSPDPTAPSCPTCLDGIPTWDVTINYVPVSWPSYAPTVLYMRPGATEFWRLLAAFTDSLFQLQLLYDGVPQPLRLVATDGVVVGSNKATRQGSTATVTTLMFEGAARPEFILAAPPASVKLAVLAAVNVDTGIDGDVDPPRTLVRIVLDPAAPLPSVIVPAVTASIPPYTAAPDPLMAVQPSASRTIYFSEQLSEPFNPNSRTDFYVTVAGNKPRVFSGANPPDVITSQGAVEDWVIQNWALEAHVFHIHQVRVE